MPDETNNVPISFLPFSFIDFFKELVKFAEEKKRINLDEIEHELNELDETDPLNDQRRAEIEENIQLCKNFSKNQIRIDKDDERVVILFDYIDVNGADVTYKNIKTLDARHNYKKQDEGVNYSAHLIINLIETDKPGVFKAALECVPQLSTSVINGVLSKICNLFRNHSRELFKIDSPTDEIDKDGNTIKKPIRISIEFKPEVSKDFLTLLKQKKSFVALSMIKTDLGNDVAPNLVLKRQELFFNTPDDDFYDDDDKKLWHNFVEILTWGKRKGYDKSKVAIKDENNITKTIIFDNADCTPFDEAHFTKTKMINGLSKMPTGCDTINDQFVERVWTHIQR